jgi:cysteine-rich repeat protein
MSKLKTTPLIAVLVLLGLLISSQTMAAVCNVPSGLYPTIQSAVSDSSCDPINVAAGVFTETGQIVINRNLTINGAGSGSTIIKPANDTGSSGDSRGWFLVNAGYTLSLSGVILDGLGKNVYQAIRNWGQINVTNCSFKNIKYPTYYGMAIAALNGSSNIVTDCTFEEIGRIGVIIYGAGTTGTISGNTYVGKVIGDWLDYAFEVGGGGSATISNNTISNNLGVASSDGSISAGILATTYFGSGTSATVTNNTISNCTEGIAVGYDSSDTTSLVANYNNISGNTDYGVDNVSNAVVVNAKYNWWGDASGPTHLGNPGGTGDSVSDNVDYDPWLQIYWKDYNGEDPGGYMPDIDQNQDFDKVLVRTEENGNGVSCIGGWLPYTDSHASGGRITYTDNAQASCTFTFTGTSIKYIGTPSNNKGIASVQVDNDPPVDVDLYSPTLKWQQVLYTNSNLSPGQHTITIVVTGRKNPLSSLHRIDVDAFDVDDIEKEYCAPVAEANSLWWLDKKYDLGLFDIQTHTEYVTDVNEDGSNNILDLVQELAVMMNTNQGHTGTTVADEQAGIDAFLAKYQLGNKLYEHTVYPGQYPNWLPYFSYIEEEIERSQDVKLDLGFWHVDSAIPMGQGLWQVIWSRRGGHAVTVAGVDSQNFLLAISDPDNDAAENGGLGVIRPVPGGHLLHPNDPSVHNNEANASHDIYTVGPSPSPGGKMGLLNFPWKWNLPTGEWETVGPVTVEWTEPLYESLTFTEIEAAVIVSPIECGNGNVDPGEECDDGNLIPGDGCSPICKLEVCGNGILDPQEECDDGNTNNGDGCDENCKIPDISVSPPSLAFGKVIAGLSSTSKTVTVKNTGNGKLKIKTISLGGTNPDQFSIPVADDHCSGQLVAPSLSCTVDVKFSPTSAGAKSATLSIPSDDPDENPVSVSLSGNGVKVIVTAPNGGESWKSGNGGHLITWLTSSTIGPVATTKLSYTINGGTAWKSISSFSGNPGTYTWYIPKVTSNKNKCKVKVVLKNADNVTIGTDKSDKVFKITP